MVKTEEQEKFIRCCVNAGRGFVQNDDGRILQHGLGSVSAIVGHCISSPGNICAASPTMALTCAMSSVYLAV